MSDIFHFEIPHTLAAIVLLPIFGALLNAIGGRRSDRTVVSTIAIGSVALSFGLALVAFGRLAGDEQHRVLTDDVYQWFSITVHRVEVPIRVRFVMDQLGGVMTLMVTGVGLLIHIYSIGYMGEDAGYARFMTYLNLFMASMLVLVLASNLPLMFVGWEGVGLCSYLLIGFWFENREYAAAGRKAFIVNRIGDFGVLIGMFLIVGTVASQQSPDAFEFSTINSASVTLATTNITFGTTFLPVTIATVASLFIFLGCTGKSAQIPLYIWLPDAMAGPTPVSALIHAATMVTAGVYLCCRLSPVIVESPFAMSTIAIVGAVTALLAASIALVQNQMKKILAYSTVSQLGFMFAAVGSGAFAGGIFHVFTHAFFKACLFLGAGSVMHAIHAHGDADVRYLGGLRKFLPRTHVTFFISCCAIAGLPFFSGFFSKDEILAGAATWGAVSPYASWVGWFVFGTLVIAATLTAFYMFRLYFLTFHGTFKGGHAHDEHHDDVAHDPHESPDSMTMPLMFLAGGALIAGLLGLPHAWHVPNMWAEWLTPRFEAFTEHFNAALSGGATESDALSSAAAAAREVHGGLASLQFDGGMVHAPSWVGWLAMGMGLLAGLGGSGLAYVLYVQQEGALPKRMLESMPGLHRLLMNKWYVDEIYGWIVIAPISWLGVFAGNFDRVAVDGVLTKLTTALVRGMGWLFTRAQTGAVYAYAVAFVMGLAGLGWWFTFPHATLTGDASVPERIEWSAGSGLGYEYRWDFDSDGDWDTEWSDEGHASHSYEGDAYYALVAIVTSPLTQGQPLEIPIEQGRPAWIPEMHVWTQSAAPGASAQLSYIRSYDADHDAELRPYVGRLLVEANATNVSGGDALRRHGYFVLAPGEHVSIGDAQVEVAVRIRGTLQVRNSFGNLSHTSEDVTMQVAREAHARADGVTP